MREMDVGCWLCSDSAWIAQPSRRPERSPLLLQVTKIESAPRHSRIHKAALSCPCLLSGGFADWGPTIV